MALVFIVGLVISTVYFVTLYTQQDRIIVRSESNLQLSQDSLSGILTNVEELSLVYQLFENALVSTYGDLNIPVPSASDDGGGGDLSSVTGLQELNTDAVTEIFDIRILRDSLNRNIEPLSQMGSMLAAEQSVLSDLPTLWPVIGGRGLVSMNYGPNIHPVRNDWYIHQGVDIPGPFGVPVVASANGIVIDAKMDIASGLGNTIVIQHKYGFRTQYSHLGRILVSEGTEVYQGQQIGTLGNTGSVSNPMVNFRIVLGTEILDPSQFIKVRTGFERWLNSGL